MTTTLDRDLLVHEKASWTIGRIDIRNFDAVVVGQTYLWATNYDDRGYSDDVLEPLAADDHGLAMQLEEIAERRRQMMNRPHSQIHGFVEIQSCKALPRARRDRFSVVVQRVDSPVSV